MKKSLKHLRIIIPIIVIGIIAFFGIEKVTSTYTFDGGKSCTDSSQCQSQCILFHTPEPDEEIIGSCDTLKERFGCYHTFKNGELLPMECVDPW